MNIHKMSTENLEKYIAKHNDLTGIFWSAVNRQAFRELALENPAHRGYNLSNIYWYCRYNGTDLNGLQFVFKIDRRLAKKILKVMRNWINCGYTPALNATWVNKR